MIWLVEFNDGNLTTAYMFDVYLFWSEDEYTEWPVALAAGLFPLDTVSGDGEARGYRHLGGVLQRYHVLYRERDVVTDITRAESRRVLRRAMGAVMQLY